MTATLLLWAVLGIDWLGDRGQKATVLLFTRTDCPIANRYAPEVQALAERYAGRGVEFVLVYPEAGVSEAEFGRHAREYGYRVPVVADPDHRYVRAARAKVTPEAAVFRQGKLVYRGRIDDRYVRWGTPRGEPTRRDLVAALDAVLAGRPVDRKETKTIGCAIEKRSSSPVANR